MICDLLFTLLLANSCVLDVIEIALKKDVIEMYFPYLWYSKSEFFDTFTRGLHENCICNSFLHVFIPLHTSFTPSRICPDLKNSITLATTWGFITAQFRWKNRVGKPSGLGAFRGPIWNKASEISFSVNKNAIVKLDDDIGDTVEGNDDVACYIVNFLVICSHLKWIFRDPRCWIVY